MDLHAVNHDLRDKIAVHIRDVDSEYGTARKDQSSPMLEPIQERSELPFASL